RRTVAATGTIPADRPATDPAADREFREVLAKRHGELAHLLASAPDPKSRDAARAVEHARKAVALGPDDAGLNNNVAWLLATCPDAPFRDPDRAVELAKRAVELAPKAATNWNTLGVAHYRAGDWKAAIAALEKSESLAPDKSLAFNAFFL